MDPRRRKALDRVVKLLARGRSANEHEASLALERAGALRREHGITDEELAEWLDAGEKALEDGGEVGDDEMWRVRVALAVADRLGCRVLNKRGRIIFDGTPRRAKRAAEVCASISTVLLSECDGIYASYGHPPIFAPVLRPILLEEAARAAAERILGREQPERFPVSPDRQRDLLDWSSARTVGTGLARMHVGWAKRDGRAAGLAVQLPEIT